MTSSDSQEWQPKWVFLEGVGWWPYGDLEPDEYEQELEASIATGEWRSVSNLEEEKERARQIARNTTATWGEEQLADVKRRVAVREADSSGKVKSPPPLAGDVVKGDNPPESETP